MKDVLVGIAVVLGGTLCCMGIADGPRWIFPALIQIGAFALSVHIVVTLIRWERNDAQDRRNRKEYGTYGK